MRGRLHNLAALFPYLEQAAGWTRESVYRAHEDEVISSHFGIEKNSSPRLVCIPIEPLWSPIEYYFVKEIDYFMLINKSDASYILNVEVSLPRCPR
jgi:hypothetical protein